MISLGLTGFPLGHSLSPRIHQAALEYSDLEGSYSLYSVAPENQMALKNLLARVRAGEITGLNVTIPYKQAVMRLLDELSPAARAIGAVNTIFMRDGRLSGDNTDAPGFMADLRDVLADEVDGGNPAKSALILGAGGAARALVWALLNDGWSITIAARRAQQAQELINQFSDQPTKLTWINYAADEVGRIVEVQALIINATPLGMAPDVERSPWPQGVSLPPKGICYDLVYNPRETCFLRRARAEGLPAATGLGMLVRQAALAFEIWTGCCVPADHLMAAVEDA